MAWFNTDCADNYQKTGIEEQDKQMWPEELGGVNVVLADGI